MRSTEVKIDLRRGRAACIGVGTELLGNNKLDLNSLEITEVLETFGFDVVEKRVVGDEIERIATAVRDLMMECEVVVVTGGLGPTADDVTRKAIAIGLGREIEFDAEVEALIKKRYRVAGRVMPEVSRSMAQVVAGSQVIHNGCGSAPGILVHEGLGLLAVFPGVPWEMREMLNVHLVPELERRAEGRMRRSRTLLLGGVGESDAEQRIHHLYDAFGRRNVSILASYGVVRLVLTASGEETRVEARLDQMENAFREILGEEVAGTDVPGLAHAVVPRLVETGMTVATAESCTGGLVGAALTEVSGSSAAYLGGVVSYSNQAKEKFVGVAEEILIEHGAVSEPVARAMAVEIRERFGADWGLGVTGIAGPTGGTEDKPVGLVHWAVAGPSGVEARHRVFRGDREIVRQWSVNAVLDLLRRRLG
ncbi:MAG: CinA family nicotinamide mononucleotide deamidase-related protein [Thermoanaerobaculales bacterium]|nr:CinA family nicotinamide mononucleotide deamidase-related protein [Thermoanaerobaculales bacterium]